MLKLNSYKELSMKLMKKVLSVKTHLNPVTISMFMYTEEVVLIFAEKKQL